MRIAWVTRSFLDYRIPVFEALDGLVEGELFLFFSGDYVPERVTKKAEAVLGNRAVAMKGEWRIGPEDREFLANKNVSLRFQPGLFREIRRARPDVLVGDGFFKWTLPALIYRIIYKVPLVICYERWDFTERSVQWYRKLYRKMVIAFTGAMCCNGSLSKAYTVGLGMPARKITTGHMSADTTGLQQQADGVGSSQKNDLRAGLDAKGIVFLYAGRLIPRKGVDELLVAWARFEKQGGSGTLVIVGEGPREQVLKEMASGLKDVRFTGAIPYGDLAEYYAMADVFIMPTLEDNWSLVVPEAMACGLPVLCSKYNGCWPELVQEKKNGWVFDPLDTDDTVGVLKAACDAENRLEEMGRWSREIVSHHSPGEAAKAVLAACRMALEP